MMQSAIKHLEQEREITLAATTDIEIVVSSKHQDPNLNIDDVVNRNIKTILIMRKEYALGYINSVKTEEKEILLKSFLIMNKNLLELLGMSVPQE